MAKYFELSQNEISIDGDNSAVVAFTVNHFNQATSAGSSAFLVQAFEEPKKVGEEPTELQLGDLEKRSNAKVRVPSVFSSDPEENQKYTIALTYAGASAKLFQYAIDQVEEALETNGADVVVRKLKGKEDLKSKLSAYGAGVYIREGEKKTGLDINKLDPMAIVENPGIVNKEDKVPFGPLALVTDSAKTAISSVQDYRRIQMAFGRKDVLEVTMNEDVYEPLTYEINKSVNGPRKISEAVRAQSKVAKDLFVKDEHLTFVSNHKIKEVRNALDLLGYFDFHVKNDYLFDINGEITEEDQEKKSELQRYFQRSVPSRHVTWKAGADKTGFSIDGYHMEAFDFNQNHVERYVHNHRLMDDINEIKSLSGVPYMKSDGTLAVEPGYDEDLKVYIDREPMAQSWDHSGATQEDAQKALQWLKDEVYVDFPFESPADLANIIGAPLMIITQHEHGGEVPLVGITAREAGTGKTFLSNILHSIVSDREKMRVNSLTSNEEELKKSIGGILQESEPMIVWDNIKNDSVIDSPTLCLLHTAEVFSTRLLGKNEMLNLVNDRLWVATGNRIQPGNDLVRRWLQVGLDAGHKNPNAMAKKYHHKDIKKWASEHREQILEQYAIMIAAWHNAGRPEARDVAELGGGFQVNVDMVSAILQFAGEDQFFKNHGETVENATSGSVEEELEAFIKWVYEREDIPEHFTSSDIYDALLEVDAGLMRSGAAGFSPVLREAPVPSSVASNWSKGKAAVSRSMGNYLASSKRRMVGGEQIQWCIERSEKKTGNKAHYFIEIREMNEASSGWDSFMNKAEYGV